MDVNVVDLPQKERQRYNSVQVQIYQGLTTQEKKQFHRGRSFGSTTSDLYAHSSLKWKAREKKHTHSSFFRSNKKYQSPGCVSIQYQPVLIDVVDIHTRFVLICLDMSRDKSIHSNINCSST